MKKNINLKQTQKMTDSDREFVKEMTTAVEKMTTAVMSSHVNDIVGRLNVFNANLVRIEGTFSRIENEFRETIKDHAERVLKIESEVQNLHKADFVHAVNCPTAKNLELLKDAQERKLAISKFVVKTITFSGLILAAIVSIIEVLKFISENGGK